MPARVSSPSLPLPLIQQVKTSAPFPADSAQAVYLDPNARAVRADGAWRIPGRPRAPPRPSGPAPELAEAMKAGAAAMRAPGDRGVGVDVEPWADLPTDNAGFVERNFSAAEAAYCRGAGKVETAEAEDDAKRRFAGRCVRRAFFSQNHLHRIPPRTKQDLFAMCNVCTKSC